MCNGDFNLILNIFTTVFSGFLASVVAIIIWEWWNKPKLSIEVKKSSKDDEEPAIYGVSSIPICDGQNEANYGRKKCAFYHLDVKNSGRTAAIDCEVECTFF